ncbi:MAG TPA: GAF domain-containing sensor histidine kinase [Chloroflexia bacterium]|nr:GAF domain-containing sensor histidine kinase [Chloroflexia bacterium]
MDLVNRSRKVILQRSQTFERMLNSRLSYARWLFVIALAGLYFFQRAALNQPASATDNNNVTIVLGAYAIYSLAVMLVTLTFGKQSRRLPVASLFVDVALTTAVCWLMGTPIFALAYLPALVLTVMGGFVEGGVAIVAVGLTNTIFFLAQSGKYDLKSEQGLVMLALFAAAFLFAVSIYVITGTHLSILKAQANMLEDAIANANSTNLQELQNRVKAVYRVASTLSATLDYQKVVRNILVEVESVFDVSVGAVMLFEGTMNYMRTADATGLTDEESHKAIETRYGIIKEALSEARPILITDEETLDELRRIFPSFKTCKSAIIMPLRGGYEVYGLLLIGSTQADSYQESDLELMVALTSHTIVAMQNATLYRNLLEDRNKMLTAEEEVRHTLARNLHDGPAQAVAAFSMQAEFIRRLFRSEPERAMEELALLGKQAQQTSKEIRTLLYELRPLVLESQGLNAALEQYASRFPMSPSDPQVHFSANDDYSNRLNPAVETTIFTILQEAVNNARKHAQARNIWLHVEFKDGFVVASSQDDGRGFDVAAVERTYDRRGSLGLTNMRERAQLVGGTVNIVSQPGRGTSIIIRIPLTEATMASSNYDPALGRS